MILQNYDMCVCVCVCVAAGQIMPCASNHPGAVHSALRELPADKVPIT